MKTFLYQWETKQIFYQVRLGEIQRACYSSCCCCRFARLLLLSCFVVALFVFVVVVVVVVLFVYIFTMFKVRKNFFLSILSLFTFAILNFFFLLSRLRMSLSIPRNVAYQILNCGNNMGSQIKILNKKKNNCHQKLIYNDFHFSF